MKWVAGWNIGVEQSPMSSAAVLYCSVLCTAGARGKVEFAVLLSSNLHDWCLYSYSVRAKNNIFLSRKIMKEARKKGKMFTQDIIDLLLTTTRTVILYNLNFSNKPNDHDPEVKLRIMKMIMVLVGIISPEVGIIYYWGGQEHN